MKIDRTKLKKGSSEVPLDCKLLIERLKGCNEQELLKELKTIKAWNYGKCELYHWIDVLDLFDSILQRGVFKENESQWALPCDQEPNEQHKELLIHIIVFTALLIEHSFSRHLYNSMEHLTTLLSSSDMQIVLAVLNLLYVFSKRSNFISRLNTDRRQALIQRLSYLAESWGGKENGFGLAECCQDLPMSSFPPSATTLHFEFYSDEAGTPNAAVLPQNSSQPPSKNSKNVNTLNVIHVDYVDQMKDGRGLAQIMENLVQTYNVPKSKQMLLFTHLRLAFSFSNYRKRLQCVQARLQALSIIVYCNAMSVQENTNNILYNGFIEELVDVLELKNNRLLDIKAAALRTLTSVIHLDHNSKLSTIIDVTGASSYHGFLPSLVRSCIQALIDGNTESFPLPFATALFSFLYHLASYENGGESLVSCGMIESLLKVIGWRGSDPEHITFVTRAVRVIDLITNLDMNSFQSHGGLNIFINRLESEIELCKKEQPFVIEVPEGCRHDESESNRLSNETSSSGAQQPSPMDVDLSPKPSTSTLSTSNVASISLPSKVHEVQCYAQRAALLKSMLNFLKKAIQDSAFSDSIRHLMDGTLPSSLRHIISNAEYYGPSLFMLATDVVTVYVFQEPSLLSSLQESGLTHVVLQALLIKDVPATREVIASLPNVFSALCLNTRGLEAFVACQPFKRIFKILLSVDYLPAMRRRRSSDPLGDTASNLGNAMDELMRHQPSLRADATTAIIELLSKVCSLGTDPSFVCSKTSKGCDGTAAASDGRNGSNNRNDGGSSDEEEDDDEDTTQGATAPAATEKVGQDQPSGQLVDKQPVPLVDYILNVMRFVDAILSNNSTDDHCKEFVRQKGLTPLLKILQLPNLPIDFPMSPACLAVASVCKSILTLAHEKEVLKEALRLLTEVLVSLEPLQRPLEEPGGSVLLDELVRATSKSQSMPGVDPLQTSSLTPLLHSMSAAHAFIIMFVHVCRTGQTDIRNISVTLWGTLGIQVLTKLSELYTSLVWESTVLLALCSESTANATWQFGRHQLEKLNSVTSDPSNPSTSSEQDGTTTTMEIDEGSSEATKSSTSSKKRDTKVASKLSPQVKQIKPLLSSASRLGRALAELFGLLVKLSVGSPLRHRRHHPIATLPMSPSPQARAVAVSLTKLLTRGLSWEPPETSPIPKFRLTFYICSVGFTSPMLFDERKYPYHLMLQQFVKNGGQDAFFKTFKWALSQGGKVPLSEGIEHPDLPDGTGEFLDSWLMLLEKMVNPKMILESPHALPNKPTTPAQSASVFDPVKYLINTQKKAFECVMHLWNKKPIKTYGERMSESVLAILCHLLKGETVIAEKLSKEKETETAAATRGGPTRRNELEEQGINADHLQQLQDMGFSREVALEALLQTSSLEQATDYILAHPQPIAVDVPMSDEDQINRAIEMSLGTSETSSVDSVEDDEPMSKQMMDDFTQDILPGCLRLLDTLPETVYRVCDLLIAVSQRNGEEWMRNILKQLIQEISRNIICLLKATEPLTSSDKRSLNEWASQLTQIPEASKAATRIHVFSLLFEEKRNECASLVKETDLIDNLIQLLEATQNTLSVLTLNPPTPLVIPTPKWLAPVILLVDLFDKAAIASTRKAPLMKLQRRSWRWFDERTGKWTSYTSANNKTIDDAYKNGESFVRFQAGRRKYTVQFCTMVQINEETGNWRPIMFINDDKSGEGTEAPQNPTTSKNCPEFKVINGLEGSQSTTLIRACVGFISIPVEPDTLHAVLRLCLRLTRNYEQAALFAESGGIRAILKLTQSSAFTGFNSLATLITRHVLEEPLTLKQTMEKVIRSTTHHSPMSCKEMHYILRVLGPAACRDGELFTEVAKNTLRISLPSITRREDDDSRLLTPNAVQMMKLTPSKTSSVTSPSPVIRTLICDLLNALTIKSATTPTEDVKEQPGENVVPVPAASSARDSDDDSETVELTPVPDSRAPALKEEESRKNRLLITQSSLLRLLAELARSYSVVARLITDHVFHPGQSDLITDETNAIAFVLDYLLPNSQTVGDKDCPALARVLLAALSSCNHCLEAQQTIVTEVKSSLHRALMLVESNEKHGKIQAITSIINTMIESCPTIPLPSLQSNQGRTVNSGLNNIVKIMLKKGMVNDLARVTHSLDLSSPHMAMTVNSALKPLETLSRIVNQPSLTISPQVKKPKTSQETSTHLSQHEAMEEDNVTSDEIREAIALVRDRMTNEPDAMIASEDVADPTVASIVAVTSNENNASETNAFGDAAVDDGTDNEANIDEGQLDFFSDSHRHPRLTSRGTMIDSDLRNESMVDEEDQADSTHRDNVVNSNGAESESGDDSESSSESEGADDDDDDDDEDSDQEEQVGVEDDDEQVEDEEDDPDDDDDEEGSAYVDTDDLEDVIGRFTSSDRDPFVFDIEEMLPSSVLQESGFLRNMIPLLESDQHVTASETTQPTVPPAPGNVAVAHPLLVRHSDIGSTLNGASSSTQAERILASRTQGRVAARSRLSRYARGGESAGGVLAANHHNWHAPVGGSRPPNPPVILQRLLGTTTAQDFLQLTGGVNSNNPARVIFASNDFQIIAADEDLFELHESGAYGNSGSASSTLGSIPSAMLRWTEESRVLDGDSMHDCISSIKNGIIEFWEKLRDEEIAERKEKRKKMLEEEEEKKLKDSNDKKAQESDRPAESSGETTPQAEGKVENETTVNATTERLAESIVEQVLGPAMSSTSVAVGQSGQSMESHPQNDNEITEMEAVTEHVAMEVNGEGQSVSESLPVPPSRENSSDPEDLSTISINPQFLASSGTLDSSVTNPPNPPEPNNVVEVLNSDPNVQVAESSNPDVNPPDELDPSFLAALPDNIRAEVIAEHEEERRRRNQARNQGVPSATMASSSAAASAFSEVSEEFLAALPPNIQEEVLAQQRAEQERAAAASANPTDPVDPANFISSLPPNLRRQVLADMDDSLLALLPPDLSSEAQNLRSELEQRHRQIQERFFSTHAGSALSRILRTAAASRGGTRYAIHTVQGSNWPWNISQSRGSSGMMASNTSYRIPAPSKIKGRQLLDHEALSCLLILLFVDEPKLNVSRLHRVLRNLSHHPGTRHWIIQSLLTIMERTRECRDLDTGRNKKVALNQNQKNIAGHQIASWLSISLDAALGCKTNVFQIQRGAAGKKVAATNSCQGVSIHPQAAPLVSRHVLDALISLAKAFPHQFLNDYRETDSKGLPNQVKDEASPCPGKLNKDADFWDVLVKLDSLSTNKKGKSVLRSHSSSSSLTCEAEQLSGERGSPLGSIINLLSHPVIKRSAQLTDRLLRLLSLIAVALPTHPDSGSIPTTTSTTTTTTGSARNRRAQAAKDAISQLLDSKPKEEILEKSVAGEDQLKLAVEVLTSKSCSEEGLEDVTSLLLRLSRSCPKTRDAVLKLLLEGARTLGFTVCKNIESLIKELRELNLKVKEEMGETSDERNAEKNSQKGVVVDRFTNTSVVITAPKNIKHSMTSKEVQLPSMAALTSKTSSQNFFLRILKVIIQLRDSIRAQKRKTNVQAASLRQLEQLQQEVSSMADALSAVSDAIESSSNPTSAVAQQPQQMEVDNIPSETSKTSTSAKEEVEQSILSKELDLDELWDMLSLCLMELADAPDHHAVLVLQPAVEAFFLVHASEKETLPTRETRDPAVNLDVAPGSPLVADSLNETSTNPSLPHDTQKFLQFADTHKIVLNQILRQSTTPLVDGPFAVLVDHTRVLDFDVKRRYFRQELERLDDGSRREDLAVHVKRDNVFEDSFRELYRRSPEEWKNRFYIVFEGEEGQDAGGLLREWYTIISREIFNPMYALFTTSPGDRVTYMINSASHCNSNHLQYFKFVGRVIAKAVYDNKLLECYFTRSFYKHILGKPVKYTDMESEDYSFYQGLVFLLEHDIKELGYELTFSVEVQEFGVTEVRDLKPNGRNIPVTQDVKHEYVRLVCQEKMTGSIRKQLDAFLDGFYEIIPKRLISIFNEQETELLISGLPNIDIDDLKANTEYHKYQVNSLQIQWFWRALRSFDQADRAKFLQFVTGTSKVPLQGFASLEGMNGTQKFQIHRDDRSTDRLPSAHTCFNQLDLPAYETYDKLKTQLLKAVRECSEGFGFA